MNAKKLAHWPQNRVALTIHGLGALGFAYLFGSLAIDSGSLWQWVLAFVLLFNGLAHLIRAIIKHKK